MNILKPINITDSMIGSGTTLAEDTTPAWVAGTVYTVGQEVHRTSTHRVYRCAADTSGTTPPELAITTWVDVRPTNRWAPFDYYTSTAATSAVSTTISYRLVNMGYYDTIYIRGIEGQQLVITLRDKPQSAGGVVVHQQTIDLVEPPGGWYEYLFSDLTSIPFAVVKGFFAQPPYELQIDVVPFTGSSAKIGLIAIGGLVPLAGGMVSSGIERGSQAEPVTYSYISTAEDGTTTIHRRHSATNLRLSATVPIEQADEAVRQIKAVLDIPVAVIGDSTNPYIKELTTFGLVSGSVTYDFTTANISLNVKGLV